MTDQSRILRLGTRGSMLARTQSQLVALSLTPFLAQHGFAHVELVTITTSGDKQVDQPLQESGGKGLFVKEIEEALLAGNVDFAVHSAKDLPMALPEKLMIAATPPRADPRDVWVGHQGRDWDRLPAGATVGTSSLRRQAQLLAARPDLKVVPFRGNIDTRLRKVAEGQVAGTFLAAAGLDRAAIHPPQAMWLPTDKFIPAACQGILALECRTDDADVRALLAHLHDAQTFAAYNAERAIVAAFSGSCLAPVAAYAEPRIGKTSSASQPSSVRNGGWLIRGLVAHPSGKDVARAALITDDPDGLPALQTSLIDVLESRGARDILASF